MKKAVSHLVPFMETERQEKLKKMQETDPLAASVSFLVASAKYYTVPYSTLWL